MLPDLCSLHPPVLCRLDGPRGAHAWPASAVLCFQQTLQSLAQAATKHLAACSCRT